MHHKLCFLIIPPKGGLPDFHFFVKCRGMDPRKQDFGQDAIQRTLRTCRQPISDNRLQMLILFEEYQQCSFDGEQFHLTSASRMTFESGRGSAILASGGRSTFYDSNRQACFSSGKHAFLLKECSTHAPATETETLSRQKRLISINLSGTRNSFRFRCLVCRG